LNAKDGKTKNDRERGQEPQRPLHSNASSI
jgi:hypothetical protein